MITTSETNKKFEQIVQTIDPHSRLLRAWELKGGVSAQVTALEIERPDGQMKKMIVRQHGAVDLQHNPQIAADEFKLLQLTRSAGLATPAPYYIDQSGDIFPDPYVVIEYVEGTTEFALDGVADYIPQFATHLARIHAVDCSDLDLAFLPKHAQRYTKKVSERPAKLDESIDEGRIRDVLESIGRLARHNAEGLLHGDFWPGNILWQAGRLVAVIDWEDAAFGDPLADVANSRLEILWAFGIDAMHGFTEHYRSLAAIDFTNLPVWDLFAALRPALKIDEWADDAIAAQRMRERHRLFVEQAFEALSLA
jgi:aminoglycoside phosphotransferase (APT) family kinase protein